MDGSTHCMRAAHAAAAAALALMVSFLAPAALADEAAAPIGHVKTVMGEAWVGVPDAAVRAEVGTPVHVGATMKTGPGASLGVTLKDETVIAIGPDSEVSVDEYLFDPGAGDLKLGASMVRGTLNFISGWIAKLRPDAETVRTPTGIIGVRGTHFLVKIDNP